MRTNIDIDPALMAEAMQLTGAATKRETVAEALRGLVLLHRQRELMELRGKINWIGDLDEMRRD